MIESILNSCLTLSGLREVCTPFFTFISKQQEECLQETPWWPSGWDSVLPLPGLDPWSWN